jgi:hypothetical protein
VKAPNHLLQQTAHANTALRVTRLSPREAAAERWRSAAREAQMVVVCPQCQSKVVTVTGYPLDTVACGNCGTEIPVPKDSASSREAAPQVTHEPEPKTSWWRRLFGG